MVKKLLSFAVVGSAGVVGACFGDGPVPPAPTKATILVAGQPIQNCDYGMYIGPVAIGSGSGFTTLLPFRQNGGNNNGCNNGGGQPPSLPMTVFAFNRDGGTLTMAGSAGESSMGWVPQLLDDGTYTWTDVAMNAASSTYVEPGHIRIGGNQAVDYAIGIARDGGDVWVATQQNVMTGGKSPPDDPEYPCCGPGSTGGGNGSIWKVSGGTASGPVASWLPYCQYTDRCFAAAGGSLFYFESPPNASRWQLSQLSEAGGSAVQLATAGQTGDVPVGIDAQGTLVAYAASTSCDNTPCDINQCKIAVYDTAMQHLTTLLSTNQFGCTDAKLADGFVYFAIVALDQHSQHLYGRGIGRVAIADRTFESLNLGLEGDSAGPRRVYPVGDRLYLVDPLVLARIDASELAGKHDFSP